jgi:hypothetical protein
LNFKILFRWENYLNQEVIAVFIKAASCAVTGVGGEDTAPHIITLINRCRPASRRGTFTPGATDMQYALNKLLKESQLQFVN